MEKTEGHPVHRRRPVLLSDKSKLVREKLRGKTFLIPSFVTVVGIFCGVLAIIGAVKGHYEYAAKCIAMAIILDGLDGRIARRLNATSAFGREFDSLSDMVAFGVAPALLGYCWAFQNLADEIGVVVSFLFIVCGATRLARFNIAEPGEGKQTFVGLPIPGAAAGVASVVYCFPAPVTSYPFVFFMLGYMAVLAVLMVSTFPFFSIKHLKLTQGNPALNLLLLSVAAGVTWRFSRPALLIGANFYAFSGLAGYLHRKRAVAQKQEGAGDAVA